MLRLCLIFSLLNPEILGEVKSYSPQLDFSKPVHKIISHHLKTEKKGLNNWITNDSDFLLNDDESYSVESDEQSESSDKSSENISLNKANHTLKFRKQRQISPFIPMENDFDFDVSMLAKFTKALYLTDKKFFGKSRRRRAIEKTKKEVIEATAIETLDSNESSGKVSKFVFDTSSPISAIPRHNQLKSSKYQGGNGRKIQKTGPKFVGYERPIEFITYHVNADGSQKYKIKEIHTYTILRK